MGTDMLSLVRAARLVGVTRTALQKKIQSGELPSFDGMVSIDSLLACYPDAELEDSAELQRITRIKERAFGKRVFERVLPDAEVLAARIADMGKTLAHSQAQLAAFQALLEKLRGRLDQLGQAGDVAQAVQELKSWMEHETESAMAPGFDNPLAARERVLSIMTAHVTVLPGKQEFLVEGQDTLLEAAVRAGIPLNYGCSGGNCGLCKARLVAGQVKKTRHYDYVMTEQEKSQNYLLLCSHTAVSDVVIEAAAAGGVQDIPFQQINARTRALTPLGDDIMLLHLETPRSQRLRFLAGQNVTLQVGEAFSAELPIASCPCDDRNLLFHVRRLPGNLFADYVFSHLRRNDTVRVEGPQGEFILHEGLPRKLYFIAFDGGFAPIKSLIEHALSLSADSIQLHWFGSRQDAIYLPNAGRAWADALDNFGYTEHVAGFDLRTLSAQRETALRNALREIAERDGGLREGNVYIAGPAAAVTLAENFFLQLGLPATCVSASIVR
jgi:CDP-4-dehydro-6-deoxyglucose reductase